MTYDMIPLVTAAGGLTVGLALGPALYRRRLRRWLARGGGRP